MMMGGGSYGMRSVMQALALPDLNDDQKAQLRKIAQDLRKKDWDLKGAMMEESDKLGELWATEPVNATAVGEAYGRLFDLQRQWIVSSIEARNQVDGVLTSEQREWLRSGPGLPGAIAPMMPPAAMMPGMPGVPGAEPAMPEPGAAPTE